MLLKFDFFKKHIFPHFHCFLTLKLKWMFILNLFFQGLRSREIKTLWALPPNPHKGFHPWREWVLRYACPHLSIYTISKCFWVFNLCWLLKNIFQLFLSFVFANKKEKYTWKTNYELQNIYFKLFKLKIEKNLKCVNCKNISSMQIK